MSNENLDDSIKKFKDLLDDQFKNAKDYKPKIEWFEGTWSRYKPEKGKDKSRLRWVKFGFYVYFEKGLIIFR